MSNVTKNVTSIYLEKYKSLEMALRIGLSSDMTVLKYEDTLTGDDADKMRMCRMVRNFLQHTPNASLFIEPTAAMISFIEKQIAYVLARAEKAKDLLYKAPVIKETSSLRETSKVFVKANNKYHWLPVVDGESKVIGVLTEARVMKAISVAADLDDVQIGKLIPKAELSRSLSDIPIVTVLDNMEPYAKAGQSVIVMRDGKYSGVIQW